MAIERLSFPHYLNIQAGIEMHPDDMPAQLSRITKRFGEYAQKLREGEYDLNPPIWTKHIYNYTLIVLDSGTGVLRLIPRYLDSHSGMLDHEGMSDFKAGGRIFRIPEDQPVAVVIGPNRFIDTLCLYEVVYFVTGPNPA